MRSTISRRFALVRPGVRTFRVFMVLIAAAVSAPAILPAHAATGDRTVALTLKCTGDSCSGSWFWYQGGVTGTLLGSGSIAGPAGSTTKGTTTQPAAADSMTFGVHSGPTDCGRGFSEEFKPGSAINFTAKVPSTDADGDHTCLGAGSSFNMKS